MERKLSETEEVRNLDCLNGGLEHRNVLNCNLNDRTGAGLFER